MVVNRNVDALISSAFNRSIKIVWHQSICGDDDRTFDRKLNTNDLNVERRTFDGRNGMKFNEHEQIVIYGFVLENGICKEQLGLDQNFRESRFSFNDKTIQRQAAHETNHSFTLTTHQISD